MEIQEGRQPNQPYYQTPLDFVSRDELALNLAWHYYNELARRLFKFSPFARRVAAIPWDRNPSDVFLRMDFDLELVSAGFILVFSSVFISAWNFSFPSSAELYLWRAASIYMLCYGVVGGLWMELSMWIFVPQSRMGEDLEMSLFEQELAQRRHPIRDWNHRFHRWRRSRQSNTRRGGRRADDDQQPKEGVFAFLNRSHNVSREKDPYMGVQVGFLIGTTVLCVFYCVFRVYIFVEDFIGLRSVPRSAYETVEWTRFIPHV